MPTLACSHLANLQRKWDLQVPHQHAGAFVLLAIGYNALLCIEEYYFSIFAILLKPFIWFFWFARPFDFACKRLHEGLGRLEAKVRKVAVHKVLHWTSRCLTEPPGATLNLLEPHPLNSSTPSSVKYFTAEIGFERVTPAARLSKSAPLEALMAFLQ